MVPTLPDPYTLAAGLCALTLAWVVWRTIARIRRQDGIDRRLMLKIEAQARHEVARETIADLRLRRAMVQVAEGEGPVRG